MRGIGTVVNVGAILLGTVIGLTLGSRLAERLRATVLTGVALLTVVLGLQEATKTHNVVLPLLALVVGGVVGEMLQVEERLERPGERLRRRFDPAETSAPDDQGPPAEWPAASKSRFVEGFVAAACCSAWGR